MYVFHLISELGLSIIVVRQYYYTCKHDRICTLITDYNNLKYLLMLILINYLTK